jgi:hypothetical protein
MSAASRQHVSVRVSRVSARVRLETRRQTAAATMSPFSPFANYATANDRPKVSYRAHPFVWPKDRVVPFNAKALEFYHPAAKPSTKADMFLAVATEPHTQWSVRKAAILELHKLCTHIINERKRYARLTPGAHYNDADVQALVAKMQQLANVFPELCGECLALLNDGLAGYIEGATEALNELVAEDEAIATRRQALKPELVTDRLDRLIAADKAVTAAADLVDAALKVAA